MIKSKLISLFPENIRDIPVFSDAIDIFLDVIEERSDISIEMFQVFEEKKEKINIEFIKIYLKEVYELFERVKTDEEILNEANFKNSIAGFEWVSTDFLKDLSDRISREYIQASRQFKERKGTPQSIEYIYNFIENIYQNVEERGTFKLIPKSEFEFEIEGGIPRIVYDKLVKPLAHPLGFVYIYKQIAKLIFVDLFNILPIYKNVQIEIRCIDPVTGEITVTPLPGELVENIEEWKIGTTSFSRVEFANGSWVEQSAYPIVVQYWNGSELLRLEDHCSLFLEYEVDYEILTKDVLTSFQMYRMEDSFGLWGCDTGPYVAEFTIGAETISRYVSTRIGMRHPTISQFLIGEYCEYIGEPDELVISSESSLDYDLDVYTQWLRYDTPDAIGVSVIGAFRLDDPRDNHSNSCSEIGYPRTVIGEIEINRCPGFVLTGRDNLRVNSFVIGGGKFQQIDDHFTIEIL